MRFIDTSDSGGPEVLVLTEGGRPEPVPGEVLIKVAAAGVNRPDIMQRQGAYPPPTGASPILGLEVSGQIVALGKDAAAWKRGDHVCALTNGGGYAEYVAVPEGQCLPVPVGLDMVAAAALPETFFTVWSNVFDRAGLKKGERFLVHGGSSGIGTTAIQMAKSMDAWVATTAGTPEKCRACEELGADLSVLYTQKDFVQEIRAVTKGYGVDVVLDMVGGDYVGRNLDLAARDGRVVSIAFLKGPKVEINMGHVLFKRLVLTGSALRPMSAESKAQVAGKLNTVIWPLIENGKIRPKIYAVFPLSDAAEAHRLMESGRHIGKIVLRVSNFL
ncbi:MAG: NAD(P)H-quinone oxidoreductase [Desulfobacterales bacterium]